MVGRLARRHRLLAQMRATAADRDRILGRLGRDVRVLDLPEAVNQVVPLARLEHGHRLAAELLVVAEQRAEADVDVVVVVAHRQRRAAQVEQRDDLSRGHRALELHDAPHGLLGDAAALLVAHDRDAVDARDVDARAHRVVRAVAGLEARYGGPQADLGQVLEHRQHAPVDLPGPDVVAAAGVDLDAVVGQDALLEHRLRQQQDLADREAVGVVAVQDVAAGCAVDRGRLEQLPAVEDRLRVDRGGAAAGRADLEGDVRGLALGRRPDAAQHGAGHDARALLERLQRCVLRVEAEAAGEVGLVGLPVGRRLGAGLEHLLLAAVLARVGPRGVGEQALLDDRALGGSARLALQVVEAAQRGVGVRLDLAAGGGGLGGLGVGPGLDLAVSRLRVVLRHRVVLGDRAQAAVRVAVAVGVLEDDDAVAAAVRADLLDDAVLDRDDRRAVLGEYVDAAARVVRVDDVGRVLALLDALVGLALGQVIGVAGAGGDGEAPLGQPGQRAHQVTRDAGDQASAQDHRVDVPVGVVVGEDRLAHVARRTGRLQIAGAGEDRVDGVVRVLLAVLVGVDAVHLPGLGHELHPAEGAGGRDVQVAAVVGLDLVDRGQVLPADAVLDAGGLVDRQQEDRHAELADDEVGDRRRAAARARQRVEERRVRAGGRAPAGAQRGAALGRRGTAGVG